MNKKFSLTLVCLIIMILLVSCATKPRVIEVKTVEYETLPLDLDESTQLLFDSRPKLEPNYPEEENRANYYGSLILAYKAWGEEWMNYSFRLEDYIEALKEILTETSSPE